MKREEEQRSRRKRIEEQQETIGLLKRCFFIFCIVSGLLIKCLLTFLNCIFGILDVVFATWNGVLRSSRRLWPS